MATCDSNDHEESTSTKNLNKGGMKNWNRIKRNVDGIPDNNVEESNNQQG